MSFSSYNFGFSFIFHQTVQLSHPYRYRKVWFLLPFTLYICRIMQCVTNGVKNQFVCNRLACTAEGWQHRLKEATHPRNLVIWNLIWIIDLLDNDRRHLLDLATSKVANISARITARVLTVTMEGMSCQIKEW